MGSVERFQEGLVLVEERCANKDNLISLVTVAMELSENGEAMPLLLLSKLEAPPPCSLF